MRHLTSLISLQRINAKQQKNRCLAQGIVFDIGASHSILVHMRRYNGGIVEVSNPLAISEAKR